VAAPVVRSTVKPPIPPGALIGQLICAGGVDGPTLAGVPFEFPPITATAAPPSAITTATTAIAPCLRFRAASCCFSICRSIAPGSRRRFFVDKRNTSSSSGIPRSFRSEGPPALRRE
jgi:hypothetical protein